MKIEINIREKELRTSDAILNVSKLLAEAEEKVGLYLKGEAPKTYMNKHRGVSKEGKIINISTVSYIVDDRAACFSASRHGDALKLEVYGPKEDVLTCLTEAALVDPEVTALLFTAMHEVLHELTGKCIMKFIYSDDCDKK